jgi:hypothetical protein
VAGPKCTDRRTTERLRYQHPSLNLNFYLPTLTLIANSYTARVCDVVPATAPVLYKLVIPNDVEKHSPLLRHIVGSQFICATSTGNRFSSKFLRDYPRFCIRLLMRLESMYISTSVFWCTASLDRGARCRITTTLHIIPISKPCHWQSIRIITCTQRVPSLVRASVPLFRR